MNHPIRRCWGDDDPLLAEYHDLEWGVPVHDDHLLYQHLVLDGFQAGLSWRTILHKREAFRRAFDGFNPEIVARYGAADRKRLLADAGIVRNRQKIEAAIQNAKAMLQIQQEIGSFDNFLWQFTGGQTLRRRPVRNWAKLPTTSRESDAMSAALKQRGFKFVGSTICYAFMQAVGMVDDHLMHCFRFQPRS
jgi:DNA-3-methyladenine glycosylase I